jgi:hypothetical protein
MDQKLRVYLKRQGISDDALDKLERGETPDDDGGVLRKGTNDTLLEKFKHRAAAARGVELFQAGLKNGHAVGAALAATLSKGNPQ